MSEEIKLKYEGVDSIKTKEGIYEKWTIDIDVDKDGEEFESPKDIDINGLDDRRMLRALFPINKNTPLPFIKAIIGSTTSHIKEGFEFHRKPATRLEFEEGIHEGLLKFNCRVQQLKNILFFRKTKEVFVLGTLD